MLFVELAMLEQRSNPQEIFLNLFENIMERLRRMALGGVGILSLALGQVLNLSKDVLNEGSLCSVVVYTPSNSEPLSGCDLENYLRAESNADAFPVRAIAAPLTKEVAIRGK